MTKLKPLKIQGLKRFLPGQLLAASGLLAAGVLLTGCNGTITSIGLPAASPWTNFQTIIASPYDDITVVTVGSDISGAIVDSVEGATCTSDQGGFFVDCTNPGCAPSGPLVECIAGAPAGATNVGFSELVTFYGLNVDLNRPAFTAGGVQLESVEAGTVGAIAVEIGGGSALNIGAAFSEGVIPGPAFDEVSEAYEEFTVLGLGPGWADFGPGHICLDGTTTSCDSGSPDNLLAACDSGDVLAFRANAISGPYSVTCGSVTVNINVNPPFDTAGECISDLKAQNCSGLQGKDRSACNHAQIGVCHASFNVPSGHS